MARGRYRKKHGHPILFVIALLIFALALLSYTFLKADPRTTHIGVLSLDEGYVTSSGQNNLGQKMLENLTSGDFLRSITGGGSSDSGINSYSIELKSYKTQEDLDRALQHEEVTGAIVIPEDYTKRRIEETKTSIEETTNNFANTIVDGVTQVIDSEKASGVKSTVGDVSNSIVDVIVNSASDPVVQQQTGNSLARVLNSADLGTYSAYVGAGSRGGPDDDDRDLDPLCHVWLLLPAILAALLLSVVYPIRNGETFAARVRRLLVVALVSAIVSLPIAIGEYYMLQYLYDYASAMLPSIGELWIMLFLVMLFVGGFAHIRPWLGAIVSAVLLLIGAIVSWVQPESFPELVLPWIIETFTNFSLTDIVAGVPGTPIWQSGVQALWIYALVGVILGIAAAALNGPRDGYEYEYEYE